MQIMKIFQQFFSVKNKNSANVGILTYDASINYGAHLQAWALTEKVREYGYYPKILRWGCHYINTLGVEFDNMKPFRDKYFPRTNMCYTEDELEKEILNFDKIIIGGDQVFRNWETTEDLPVLRYYGDFVSGNKTLASFSASFGTDTFNGDDYLVNECRKLLKRFDKISVREKSGVDILNNTFGVEGAKVLDPVFLQPESAYIKLIENAGLNSQSADDYIAYMCLGEQLGLCEINPDFVKRFDGEKFINVSNDGTGNYNSVETWLNYVKNSKFVITDSFHCLAFAIIFHKPFMVVDRDFGGNARIDDILSKFNLEYLRRNSLTDIVPEDLNLGIDWQKVDGIIAQEKQKSENFLQSILEIKPKYKEPYINNELRVIREKYEKIYTAKLKDLKKQRIKNTVSKIFSVKNQYSENYRHKIITILGLKIKVRQKLKHLIPNMVTTNSKNFKTVHYLIAMLKAYGIHNIISSPGCQNAMFNLIVQDDDYFNCYSVTDERSAAFMASGIAEETGEPVVITCTGSSASRNYVPALTEAYYRSVPVIAIPFYNRASNEYNLAAQFTDRSITQKDIKTVQVKLPEIHDYIDKTRVLTYLNAAISEAKYNKKPVIIECPSIMDFSVIDKSLPDDIWKTEFINDIKNTDKDYLKNKNIAVFIGSHSKFTAKEQEALSNFALSCNAPVFCDHTSNYKGKNKILSARAITAHHLKKPDLIIDIGGVTGDYFARGLFDNAEIWRISPKGKFNCRYDLPVTKTFVVSEKTFFSLMKNDFLPVGRYFSKVQGAVKNINIPELPLSNYLIIQNLAKYIPEHSVLHHGVSNTKRGMNFFDFSNTIDISCNVGVCGIDGAVSIGCRRTCRHKP